MTTYETLNAPDDDADVPQVPVTDDLVIDLLEDAREVGGVLGYGYPTVPSARRPEPAGASTAAEGEAAG